MNLFASTYLARRRAGLTLTELEALTGIGKTTLNNIENGTVSPRLDQLEAIARATGTKITDLFDAPNK